MSPSILVYEGKIPGCAREIPEVDTLQHRFYQVTRRGCESSLRLLTVRCRANMAHIRQSRPNSGLGFQVFPLRSEVVEPFLGQVRFYLAQSVFIFSPSKVNSRTNLSTYPSLLHMKNKLTNLWGNWHFQNDFINTFCEINLTILDRPPPVRQLGVCEPESDLDRKFISAKASIIYFVKSFSSRSSFISSNPWTPQVYSSTSLVQYRVSLWVQWIHYTNALRY